MPDLALPVMDAPTYARTLATVNRDLEDAIRRNLHHARLAHQPHMRTYHVQVARLQNTWLVGNRRAIRAKFLGEGLPAPERTRRPYVAKRPGERSTPAPLTPLAVALAEPEPTAVKDPVTIDGPLARVTFDRFDLDAYELFIRTKALPESQVTYDVERDTYEVTTPARFAGMLGAEVPAVRHADLPIAAHLFDYQRWALGLALDARRFALWIDTGLGKTAIYLEWARQVHARTGGKVLILTPLAVIPQVIAEAERWYGLAPDKLPSLPIRRLDSRDELIAWLTAGPRVMASGTAGIEPPFAIVNYEKFIPGQVPELRYLAGIVADESSALKTGGGKIKWNLIHSSKGIEYKLSCTATPAPNEAMEYASQAAWLETIRNEGDILWTWFQRDKRGEWSIKPHGREAFYRFMASWSLYMRDPAAFGFGDILATLPAPVMHEERIPITDDQRALMTDLTVRSGKGFIVDDRLGVKERAKFAQIARGFIYQPAEDGNGKPVTVAYPVQALKPQRVAAIARAEVAAGRRVLIWTTFDEEGEIIRRLLPDVAPLMLTGSQTDRVRSSNLDAFRAGETRCLISKPSLIGYGLNLQFVTSMIFSGIDDSMERRYQAIRRAYRFGQTEPVHVHTVYVPELEGVMFENVAQKEARFFAEVAVQERHYRHALGMELSAA